MSHPDTLRSLIEYQKEKKTTMIPWTDLTPRQKIDVLLCVGKKGKLPSGVFRCDSGFSVRVYNRTSYNKTALITVKKTSSAAMKLF